MELHNKLATLKKIIPEQGVEVDLSFIENGKTYEVLCQTVDKIDVNAIRIGVDQNFLFGDMIGSTTEKVCRMAKQKVIVLNDSNSHKISKVLCAFDFSDNSVAGLQLAVNFANCFGAKLKVIHVLSITDIATSASK